MEIYIITFVVMLLAVISLAVGVIFKGEPLAGSCGGAKKLAELQGEELSCDVCGATDISECKNEEIAS